MANDPISFIVSGQLQGAERGALPSGARADAPAAVAALAALAALGFGGTLKQSVRLAAERGGGETVRVDATPGEDVVVLHINGGPSLVLHPESARDLLLGQGTNVRGAATPTSVAVPAQLRWRGLEQAAPTRAAGFLGSVLLSGLDLVSGVSVDDAADFAASAVVKKVDGQVDAGVYALPRSGLLAALKGSASKLAQVPAAPGDAPLLVLIHGTFVDTASTFGKLWALHPQSVSQLFDFYAGRVFALDHPTLGCSPIANALTLVNTLPRGARLHLVTHSRGGLVAEVLARLCSRPDIGAADLQFFAGPAYAVQRQELQALAAAVKQRGIRVERLVRVACPARGTLLASKRLDAYVSVLKWSLELAGLPVLPELLGFLGEVARRRADPTLLPGLAAMLPDSPLVNWLNTSEEAIAGELRVVAGDLQGDSVGSWIKTLLADAYYWGDNDIVVQTRSMYGGAPRADGAAFVLDQGGKVTHFNYFVNPRTVDAVVAGLTLAQPAGYRCIGPLSWAGEDAGGVRGAVTSVTDDGQAASAKPALFVLPGILGSNLAVDGKRIWLSLRLIGGLARLAYTGAPDGVQPDGPIGLVYNELIAHLGASHHVIPFAFDWRRPIEDEARRLADAVDVELQARQTSGQPVRLLAHSMGGLVARTMQLERPDTWSRMMARDGARLVMLGTPNGGSWAPMQVLSGDDTFGNTITAFGSPLQDHAARQLMANMPGFLQLQASLLDPALQLASSSHWAALAAADLKQVQQNNWWHRNAGENTDAAYEWGVPGQAVLDQAQALRRRLDAQVLADLPKFADKLVLVVGHAKFTPDGYEEGDAGLVYLNATDGGDGRVPLELALLPGVRTWTLDAEHGSLPSSPAAFEAFDELLTQGDTERLARLPAASTATTPRGAAAPSAPVRVRSRPSRGLSGRLNSQPADSKRAVFQTTDTRSAGAEAPAVGAALRVSVLNGNLSFINQPLLVGHYQALALTGTEGAVNTLVQGAMQASLNAGVYPSAPGTHQIFINRGRDPDNPWRAPRPQSVVVLGLGDEGKLSEAEITLTVRQGTIAWAQRVAEAAPAPTAFELAATLLGSGGVGVYAGSAARAIAQGVREANERLLAGGWPVVSRLTLVELYLERASDAWHGLQVLATACPGRYEIQNTVQFGTGALRRQVDNGYRSTDYDFVRATTQGEGGIAFALDSKRARTEVRAQMTQARLVRELVQRASSASNQDPLVGRTLFQLLVPLEVEPFLGGTSRMLLELDEGTATIPWELLDTPDDRARGSDARPWAIRSSLLRKLRVDNPREQVQDANREDNVLVIGEPLADPTRYARLPGALAEAKAVAHELGAGGVSSQRLTALLDHDDASTLINALYARRYRIVHIAGHGEPGAAGGVVMSGGTFLGPREIDSMRVVPELVFVNCCHLAARQPGQALRDFDRSAFAANVADALIRIGVRCVIAAGWAVDDGPAAVFATTFYRQLLRGEAFINAAAVAREAAWAEGGNTWAAYQCYGDPDWRFNADGPAQAGGGAGAGADEYTSISSPLGLALALEELAVQSRYQRARPATQIARTRQLEARFAALWGDMGAVAEAFAVAYADAGARALALPWYERALRAGEASASMKASEQAGNLRARLAWESVKAEPGNRPVLLHARAQIQRALTGLQALADLQPTVERHSLCGSAYKRLALLERHAGAAAAEAEATARSAQAYARAETLAATTQPDALFYPGLNRMAAELLAALPDASWPGFSADESSAVRTSLQAKTQTEPDFFSMLGLVELEVYGALAKHKLSPALAGFANALADLHERVSSPGQWASVADQAEFVLPPYAAANAGAEANAANALLALLRGYATA